MAGRVYLEHGLRHVDVLRDVVAREVFETEVAWNRDGPLPDQPVQERRDARTAGWEWARHNTEPGPGTDVSWAINQATGGLRMSRPTSPLTHDGLTDAGWFRDPVVDEGAQLHTISPALASLGRRPGVVYLAGCEHIIDHPIYLYPGQTLRGAGFSLNDDGEVIGGTRIVLRGPDARIVGIRYDQRGGCRSSCTEPGGLFVCPSPGEETQPSGARCYTSEFPGAGPSAATG